MTVTAIAHDFDRQGNLVPLRPRQPAPQPTRHRQIRPRPADLRLDRERDALLTAFGKATLKDRYLLPGEGPQDMFARVACAYVHYICDWRLSQLRLPTLHGYFRRAEGGAYEQTRPHPLPWLVEILNGVEHANFFEQRATEYSKAATQGDWTGSDGVWAMFDARKDASLPSFPQS